MARSTNHRSARERNQAVREQQMRLSEERRMRSLRSEDFQMDEPTSPAREDDRVRFQSMTSSLEREEQERERPADRSRSRRQRQRRTRQRVRTEQAVAPRTKEKRERKSFAEVIGKAHESDFSVIASMILLCFIGLVMVTSSSYYYAYNKIGNPLYFLYRQAFYLGISTVVLIAAMYIPLWIYRRLAWAFYAISFGMALAVLIFGINLNGSTRWLSIAGIQFQPSELVKLGVALFVAVKAEQYQDSIKSFRTFVILLVIVAVPALLVAYQNLTSGIIIAMIGLTIMLVAGCRIRYFVILGLLGIALLAVVIVLPMYVPLSSFPGFMRGFLEKFMYRTNRVRAFLDPFKYVQNEGYQIVQSLYAIGSGGFFGQGLGESIQKLGFIPEAYNDIIFAIICDELGLLGAGLVMILFGILIYHGGRIAMCAPDPFTTYLAAGLVCQVGLQAILNIAVSTNSIPATGVSLPFISYGGTSILFLMVSMGLLLNISRYTRQSN